MVALLSACLFLLSCSTTRPIEGFEVSQDVQEELARYVRASGKKVLTFVGYSGAGYEDEPGMLKAAGNALDQYDPAEYLVNIGATAVGIGAVYDLAKARGFQTTGIVSSQARAHQADFSPNVDKVFFIEDAAWGGIDGSSGRLTPTSQAIVDASDVIVGIGGGGIARDELAAAIAAGKTVHFHPADMNHDKAIASAKQKGTQIPADFRGEADGLFER